MTLTRSQLRQIIRETLLSEKLKGPTRTPGGIEAIGLKGGKRTALAGMQKSFDMPPNAEFLKQILPDTPLDKMHPDMLKFITAIPSALAQLGHAKDEKAAIRKTKRMIGSTYRGAERQAHAMYGWPYKHDLRYRKKGCKPGHYYFASKTGKCASAPTKGVYGSAKMWQDVFDEFERASGGSLSGHAAGRSQALSAGTAALNAGGYGEKGGGHIKGTAFDLPGGQSGKYNQVLAKAAEISGVNYKAFPEVDHYHVSLAESVDDDVVSEQIGGSPRFNKHMNSSWEGWVHESDNDSMYEDDSELVYPNAPPVGSYLEEDDSDGDTEDEGMEVGDDARAAMGGPEYLPEIHRLTRASLRELILREVQQISLNPSQSPHHEPRPTTPRPVIQGTVKASSASQASSLFSSERNLEGYSVRCEESPPGSGNWSCVANRSDLGAEQSLSYPGEEAGDWSQ